MRITVFFLLLAVLLKNSQAEDNSPLAKLSPILGSWASKATFREGDDEPRSFTSQWTAKRILDDNHIIIESTDTIGGKTIRGLSIISHNANRNELRMTIYSSFHPDPVGYHGRIKNSVVTWTLADGKQPNQIVMTLNFRNPKKISGSVITTNRATGLRQSVESESTKKTQ